MTIQKSFERDVRHYLAGFFLCLALTVIPFGLVALDQMSGPALILCIGVFAIAQIIVQLKYFLHIDLSRQKREDLLLILFSTLLLSIMAGGTIWIMANLAHRMHP